MNYRDVTSRNAVLAAIAECDRLGRDAFLTKYGFMPAREYVLRHSGQEYDSKAILGVAYKYQFGGAPLRYDQFSGGRSGAAGHLDRLGFVIDGLVPDPRHWSLAEVETLVADYFVMLRHELRREPYSKADHRRALLASLSGRTPGYVERKHQNVSAILQENDLPYIDGYKPLHEYQLLLQGVVLDYVDDHPDLFDEVPATSSPPQTASTDVFASPPAGTGGNRSPSRPRPARIVNFADRDATNHRLGKAGEQWVAEVEKRRLCEAGRPDLAERVSWVAQVEGDGHGYDIASFREDGEPLYIEVKTTNGGKNTPFLISPNEVAVSQEKGCQYAIYRVFDFGKAPRVYVLTGDVRQTCNLVAASWRAFPGCG